MHRDALLRYALLWHDCPADYRDGPHYDLLVERPGRQEEHRLAAWSLLELPAVWSRELGRGPIGGESVEATPLADHRAAYLDYEGPVSGGRGSVVRVAWGAVEWLELSATLIRLRLSGPLDSPGPVALRCGCGPQAQLSVEA